MRSIGLRILLMAGILFASLNNSDAQYKSPVGSTNIGFTGALGINFLEGAQFQEVKPGMALAAGFSLKYYQTITLGLQADFLILQSVSRYTKVVSVQNERMTVKYKQEMTFLTVPVNINFYLSDRHESEMVYLSLGGIPSFLISAKISDNLNSVPKTNNEGAFRNIDFAFCPGIGIESRRWDLLFEYGLGLINLNGEPGGSRISSHGPRLRFNYFLKRWE